MIYLALMKSIVENFTLIYDKCFLLRSMKAKRFNVREPWYTKGLAKSKRKRCKSYLQVIPYNAPKSSIGNAYKSYKNTLILFELLSVYVMKNNFKNLNQMLRPLGGY